MLYVCSDKLSTGKEVTGALIRRNLLFETYQLLQFLNAIYNKVEVYYIPYFLFMLLSCRVLVNSVIIRASGSGSVPAYFVLALISISAAMTIVESNWFWNSGNLYQSSLDLKSKFQKSRRKFVRLKAKSMQLLIVSMLGLSLNFSRPLG